MQGSSQDAKEQIRQAIDIVDLVGGFLPLRRQGRGYVANCPWHDDSRPSLQINPERQSWKCWVCDVGGDIFSFVMKMERVEFREAMEMLAEKAGVSLQAVAKPASGSAGDKRTLFAALAWAEEQFHRCLLQDPQAEPVRNYLADRKISAESIRKFRLGFSPPAWDWLVARAANTAWTTAVLERVGLILQRTTGEGWYDRFRGRVMFPIHDVRDRPIAFGGRIMPQFADDRSAKYVNSPETPLFSKSSQLYGLAQARDAVARAKQVVVMEGYTDVIMAHQHGVEHAVAVLGTALNERHLPLLRRFTDRVVLVLDGDEAGQRRSAEILELFIANQLDLRVLTLPEQLDPCDFIAEQGGDAFLQMLGQAVDALEHRLRLATRGVSSSDTHQVTVAVEQVLATLAKSRRGMGLDSSAFVLREQQVLSRLAREFRLPEEQLRVRLRDLRRGNSRSGGAITSDTASEETLSPKISAFEKELLELALTDGAYARKLGANILAAELSSPLARGLYQLILEALKRGDRVDYQSLMLAVEDAATKSLLVELDEACHAKAGSDASLRLQDLLSRRERGHEDAQRQEDLAAFRDKRFDPQQEEIALEEFFAKLKSRQTGSLSTDG
ncbi:MAG: DNA primase [Pirellulales bacterium]